jgi:antitoxin StbD
MTYQILSTYCTSISDLKKHPMRTINEAEGEVVAVLNRNQPAFYCVSPVMFERMVDLIDDIELVKLAKAREGEKSIEVSLNDI